MSMTRLDAADEREALKEEIKQELRHEDRRRKTIGCLVSFLLMASIVTVPLFIVGSMLAKTGFVDVPLLSGWLYKPSEPVRVVRPLSGSNGKQVMQSVTSKAQFDPAVSTVTVSFSEEELTTLAQGMLTDPSHLPFEAKTLQVAVMSDYVELFAVSVRPKRNATVRLRFLPVASKDGGVRLDIRELLIGRWLVPKSFSRYVTNIYAAEIEQTANAFAKGIGALRTVELKDGKLTATFRAINNQ